MAVKITCIDKPSGNLQDPHEAISQYGWFNETTQESGVASRDEMVDFMKKGGSAYVKDSFGNQAFCRLRQNIYGTEFLQTITDGKWSDNLLSLPRCTY